MKSLEIAIGADHAGFELKNLIIKNLTEILTPQPLKITWKDFGTESSERCDYPLIAKDLCSAIQKKPKSIGVLICGSGVGMAITANKFSGIRAITVESEKTAKLCREHNDVNVLCLGARILSPDMAVSCIQAWLNAEFQGGRHQTRLDFIKQIESSQ
jgi:ribose 5-phosphate isomerase B